MDKRFKEAYASLAQDKNQRHALASLIVDYIDPQHITENIVGLMLNTRSLDPGDALVKKVRKGIDVRTLVPGSVHLASEITVSDRVNYMLDGADIKVKANLWELESGELGTVEEIRREMQANLQDYYINRVFTSLGNVWTAANTPNNYATGAELTATMLRDAIDWVRYTVGRVRAVVGTRRGLGPITQFGGFHTDGTSTVAYSEGIREIYESGWVGSWYGANIVALDQVWDNLEDYNAQIPNNLVLVLGENVGEFITYGEPRWKQWEEMQPTPPDWFIELYQQWGLIVDNAMGIYVLDITSLS